MRLIVFDNSGLGHCFVRYRAARDYSEKVYSQRFDNTSIHIELLIQMGSSTKRQSSPAMSVMYFRHQILFLVKDHIKELLRP